MKYIAFCDTEQFTKENRSVAPSAASVVKYMADVFGEVDDVEIISPSRTLNSSGIYRSRTTRVSEHVIIKQPFSIGVKTKTGKMLVVGWTRLWLFFYLLFRVKKAENIVVYHSLSYMKTISLLKIIKKLKVILEIREIYSDINIVSEKVKKQEKEYFDIADGYVFATEILNTIINEKEKPYVIASGVYKVEQKMAEKMNDDKIHIVYAGNLKPEKGGATNAINSARFLNENYWVHILGYGTSEQIEKIKHLVDEVNLLSRAQVSYDGVLNGQEFTEFLQTCHIGLAVQNFDGIFNMTSFPSKILTYLSNELDVLSTNIPAVSGSGIGQSVYYCDSDAPKEIARKIMEIDVKNSSSKREVLASLDTDLRRRIEKLIV